MFLQAHIDVYHYAVGWPLLVLAQNVVVQSGFLDPSAAADVNGRNPSALYEIVDRWERNPQVLGGLFHGKAVTEIQRETELAFGHKSEVFWEVGGREG
jgi:hypothetical protein